jgi:putative flippase GtrA
MNTLKATTSEATRNFESRLAGFDTQHRIGASPASPFAGLVNTLLMFLVFLFLLGWVQYQLAYAIAFGMGAIISYGLNRWFVFKGKVRRFARLVFPVVLVGLRFVASIALELIVLAGAQPAWALALAVVVV